MPEKHGGDEEMKKDSENNIRTPPRSTKRNSTILVNLENEAEAEHDSFNSGLNLGKW